MSKYISRTKSKIIFKENAEKEIGEKLAPTSNKILADIMRRREAFRERQIERAKEREKMIEEMRKLDKPVAHSVEHSQNPALDEFEKEYEAFIAEQKRLKAEREANEVKNEVISEADTTSENSEEVQVVETKPKKRRKKKKVVETTETLE